MGQQLLAWLAANVISSKNMFHVIMSFALIWQGTQLQEMNKSLLSSSHLAKTEYAYNVLEFGYRNDSNEQEIIDRTKKWVEADWGAQVAALHTLCGGSPNRLNTLVSPHNVITLCRLAR